MVHGGGGVAERPCVRLQNKYTESEFIRVRIPSPPLEIIGLSSVDRQSKK